jgi:primosomal protein N' (replication factor Y)
MKGLTKFIIDVVPLTRIPLTRNQSFSYLHDEKLPAGTLVSIPLFRRKVEGIVLGSRDDFKRHGGIELKKVERIIEIDFLTKKQLELAQFISDYYISPLGVVLKSFVPKRVRSKKKEARSKQNKKGGIILTKEQQLAVEQITKLNPPAGGQNSNFLLFGPAASGKTEVYIHSILKLREKDPVKFDEAPNHGASKKAQFLILVPEQTLTPQAYERYGQYFPAEEIVVLSSSTSRGQFYENWRRVKSGEAKIIIATRKGVLSPFGNLRLVVIDEEQDMSYKQWDMNPRYDARKVAEKLAEIHKCPIVRGSATPSVESYYRADKKELKLIEIPELEIPLEVRPLSTKTAIRGRTSLNIEIVDMKKERWAKNYSCISKKLKYEIGYALKNKLQTILLINRQGMSSFSVCEACKTVLKCPKCDRALVYDEKGHYRCIHCAYKTSITPACSKCKGIIFKNVGLGTQKVEREVANLFPDARVARIDSQAIRVKNYQERVYKEFSKGETDILVGTQMITKGWDLPNVALVGIIDTDNMLSIPDFSASQKAYELINQVAGRVNRPGAKFPGVVVIQTYNPENKLLKLITRGDYAGFYEKEIAERKELRLPPFSQIIKLTIQDYNKNKAEKSAEGVCKLLKSISGDVKVGEDQEAYVSKIRGRFRRQIILKTQERKWPAKIIKLLKSLSSEWIVDVDPISII